MNIRILAASALALVAMMGTAMAETRNGNWDKCPGGFDSSTNICMSRDKYDGVFPKSAMKSSEASAASVLLRGYGSEN